MEDVEGQVVTFENVMARCREKTLEEWGWLAFTLSVAASGCSMPVARGFLVLAAVGMLSRVVRARVRVAMPAVAWLALFYVLWLAAVTLFGINPSRGLPKLPKLLWFLFIPVAAYYVNSGERLRRTMEAYVLGVAALAVQTCIRNPLRAMESVSSGEYATLVEGLIDNGSITNGERLMVGMIASIGLVWLAFRERRRVWAWMLPLAVISAAFLLNFKRGSWFVAAACIGVFLAVKAGWRLVLAGLAVVMLMLLLPPVQTRLGELRREADAGGGGRLTMWTKVAPAVICEHPFGIGYRALTNEMMRRIAPEVEADRDHVHNNVLQVLVEAGWVGLCVYLVWMGVAVTNAIRAVVRASGLPGAGGNAIPWLLLLMLLSLVLNGVVEYNLGDSEIVLLYVWLVGASAIPGCRRDLCEG